jgi:hypothetical protein
MDYHHNGDERDPVEEKNSYDYDDVLTLGTASVDAPSDAATFGGFEQSWQAVHANKDNLTVLFPKAEWEIAAAEHMKNVQALFPDASEEKLLDEFFRTAKNHPSSKVKGKAEEEEEDDTDIVYMARIAYASLIRDTEDLPDDARDSVIVIYSMLQAIAKYCAQPGGGSRHLMVSFKEEVASPVRFIAERLSDKLLVDVIGYVSASPRFTKRRARIFVEALDDEVTRRRLRAESEARSLPDIEDGPELMDITNEFTHASLTDERLEQLDQQMRASMGLPALTNEQYKAARDYKPMPLHPPGRSSK